MDLNQRKLTKSEWDSIEIPVSREEHQVLKLLCDGVNNINIRQNYNLSVLSYLKLEPSEKISNHVYIKYFQERCQDIKDVIYKILPDCEMTHFSDIKLIARLNSGDKIRFERNNIDNIISKNDLYENVLIYHTHKFIKYYKKGKKSDYILHYYTLNKLVKNTISHVNVHVLVFVKDVLNIFNSKMNLVDYIINGAHIIEKNKSLLKYDDLTLYEHQRSIINAVNSSNPKLILYMAPTGTGKTLTPIALSEKYKIIFVCAARHVGLALAKSAISINKKVAFAFGCNSADDIRLHYFAAKEYDCNKRSGGIYKVDNSVGDNVEIMICDIKSYLCAMYYMRSFSMDDNGKCLDEKIITYWDEPTITLDYDNHEFHEIISKNWRENLIPNMVLSSATLPSCEQLHGTISDFRCKFKNAEIKTINSYDCKKSIPIITSQGYVELPHYMSEEHTTILEIQKYCADNLTLLRYFDLGLICDFVVYVNKNDYISNRYKIESYFESVDNITMQEIKLYYLIVLKNIYSGTWGAIYNHFKVNRKPRLAYNNTVDKNGNKIIKSHSIGPGVTNSTNSRDGNELTRLSSQQLGVGSEIENNSVGLLVTTKDAYSLTDGPTIFITNDVEKIATFCIQQLNIPSAVMKDLMVSINYNNKLNEQLTNLESELEFQAEKSESTIKNEIKDKKVQGRNKSTKDVHMNNRDHEATGNKSAKALTIEINNLRALVKPVTLNDVYVPNKPKHLNRWASLLDTGCSYTSNIDEPTVNEIMLLNDVNDTWKLLLMMGIGVFMNHTDARYTEIMKKMADMQKLYLIIASSDYIYGTNYQFCHGYIGKDLALSQDKVIQAMGRIGRNNIQQDYTVRFRDNNHIKQLFREDNNKPEVRNMNILFNS